MPGLESWTTESGAALILALAVITVVGLMIGALLSMTDVNLRSSSAAGLRTAKIYAADTGIEYVIQQLRQGSCKSGTLLVGPAGIGTPGGQTVTYTCLGGKGGPGDYQITSTASSPGNPLKTTASVDIGSAGDVTVSSWLAATS